MQCKRCGAEVAEGAAFCSACGEPARAVSGNSPDSVSESTAQASRPPAAYAGFWLRLIAYVIDCVLLGIAAGITVLGPLLQHAGIPLDNPWALLNTVNRQIIAINLLLLMASWLYWALLESSPWQATVGKKLLGLYVTDLQGKRLTFARASARFFGKIVSNFTLLIGYLMAGFTGKKQALHDTMSGSLVLKRQ